MVRDPPMPAKLTVGVTTQNEKGNIKVLLDRLAQLDSKLIEIILYDDASTDGTAALIAHHHIATKSHFQAHLAEANFGSPSAGRQYIANRAQSDYITFIDGDDLVDPETLTVLAKRLRPGFDIILTP